jgi:hypothetical protein
MAEAHGKIVGLALNGTETAQEFKSRISLKAASLAEDRLATKFQSG